MILKKASTKAVRYSCMNFHYAKIVPISVIAYSVFNDKGEWCGCITFGYGAGNKFAVAYGVIQGEYLELSRMALNGKQESTSKALAVAIRLIKKDCPAIRLLISYADKGQKHYGTIYQATNWLFVAESKSSGNEVFYKGKWVHDRGPNALPKAIREKLKYRKKSGKIKYLYPLDKEMRIFCEPMIKPYIKQYAHIA